MQNAEFIDHPNARGLRLPYIPYLVRWSATVVEVGGGGGGGGDGVEKTVMLV